MCLQFVDLYCKSMVETDVAIIILIPSYVRCMEDLSVPHHHASSEASSLQTPK